MRRRRLLLTIIVSAILIPLTAVIYHRLIASTPIRTSPDSPTAMVPPPLPSRSVIVVGSGLAGLAAAYSALQAGANSVRVLERSAKPGGNSMKASSGINGAPTRFQLSQLRKDTQKDTENADADPDPDTERSFWQDTIASAGSRFAPSAPQAATAHRKSLITTLVKQSAEAIDFLSSLGVDLSVVAQLGGHSHARTHRGAGKTPPGASIMTTLLGKLKEEGPDRFAIFTECEVTRLLTSTAQAPDPAPVTGVEYTQNNEIHTLSGPVIFATGGFAGDTHGLLAQHRPDLAGLPSTNENRPGAHNVLSRAGAKLVDMDSVQIHPTGFVDPANPQAPVKFLAAEMLRGEGGILLYQGRRFVNELDTREHVSRVIMDLPEAAKEDGGSLKQWDVQLLLDPGAAEAAEGHVGFYLWKGLLKKVKVKDLDEATRQTVEEYAALVRDGRPDEFGRRAFGRWKLGVGSEEEATIDEQEVCIGRVTPITHFTMGGVLIDENARVLASDIDAEEKKPIPGLWAAGEITGGVHGDNRLGGSSLLECVVFGRVAGKQAVLAVPQQRELNGNIAMQLSPFSKLAQAQNYDQTGLKTLLKIKAYRNKYPDSPLVAALWDERNLSTCP
ncbi:FAD binding domain-containing protein [Podospora appendiculata]|uniref:FAD binding domain-containing protein n=1 Tax=Podospora appendiculata TaxID=314037 RepID=A0AAE1CDY5_9PEZI|nr:FAD binding domain-containing protein [Podospora appendiculata]